MSNHSWYVIRTHSGYEKKVKASLEQAVNNLGLQNKIPQIVVPSEEVVEIRNNKRYVKERPFFPGYVFIEMALDNDVYWLVRNTTGVSGFLGGVRPIPMSEEEVNNLKELISKPATKPKPAVLFEKGETVRIIDGPFQHFLGSIEEIDEQRGKLKIMVTIFGRATPIVLNFFQVEKL